MSTVRYPQPATTRGWILDSSKSIFFWLGDGLPHCEPGGLFFVFTQTFAFSLTSTWIPGRCGRYYNRFLDKNLLWLVIHSGSEK